jgi:hypothetical protein
MQETKHANERTDDAQRADKLYVETNLLRIAGALFYHDQKIARTRTDEIELNRGVVEKHISIRPDPKLGQPGPLAHKIFIALIKKHSDYGKPIRNEIHFTRREIGRLIGRSEWGGRDSEQLSRALHEIHYAFVKTHFKQSGGRFVEHSFHHPPPSTRKVHTPSIAQAIGAAAHQCGSDRRRSGLVADSVIRRD